MVPFDAVLLVSFGGPEGPDDVEPFLANVTTGRDVPPARLAAVAEEYLARGGVSPINGQSRALLAALDVALRERGIDLPAYWGNRNWHPFLADTVAAMSTDGRRAALAIVTSAFPSHSGCRQYQEDIAAARDALRATGQVPPTIVKLAPYGADPRFAAAQADRVLEALAGTPTPLDPAATRMVFTAHSIPMTQAAGCRYEAALRDTAGAVATMVQPDLRWDLAFQSRSGPPNVPWLEPDIGDHLRVVASEGVTTVVVVPLGFVSDHMEVVVDLDTKAAVVAAQLGLDFVRVPTVGTHPAFVALLADLVAAAITSGTTPACAPTCCPPV